MLNKIKLQLDKNYIVISLICFIVCNLLLLDNKPFGDDYIFIFGETEIKNAPNPFLFFFPWSDYFKSWSLTYFIFWNMYKVFGINFVYYRAVNLALHFLNFFILSKITKNDSKKKNIARIMALCFLFAPISILTTTWIFQLKTLLAVFFILIFLYSLQGVKNYNLKDFTKLYVYFVLSLLSKVSGVLIPLYLFFILRTKCSIKKSFIFVIPFFITSLIYGLINIKGITHILTEIQYMNKPVEQAVVSKNFSRSQALGTKNKEIGDQKEVNFNINILGEITSGSKHYFTNLTDAHNLLGKYILSLQNFGRFILSSIGLYDFYPFYEKNLQTILSPWLYVYTFIGIFTLYALVTFYSHSVILLFALFIPISGFFYIPYMKFSYSSDHWFYTPLIGLIIFLSQKLVRTKTAVSIFTIIFISYLYTQYKFTTFEKLLKMNAAAYSNNIILEHQTRQMLRAGKSREVLKMYSKAYIQDERENIKYSQLIHKIATKLGRDDINKHFFNQSAKLYLQTHDINFIRAYTLSNYAIYPQRILELTESFNAIYTQKIDRELYLKVESYLR